MLLVSSSSIQYYWSSQYEIAIFKRLLTIESINPSSYTFRMLMQKSSNAFYTRYYTHCSSSSRSTRDIQNTASNIRPDHLLYARVLAVNVVSELLYTDPNAPLSLGRGSLVFRNWALSTIHPPSDPAWGNCHSNGPWPLSSRSYLYVCW